MNPRLLQRGRQSLEVRGNVTPEEIHKLANRGEDDACHSDDVKDADHAKLVPVNTLKAHR